MTTRKTFNQIAAELKSSKPHKTFDLETELPYVFDLRCDLKTGLDLVRWHKWAEILDKTDVKRSLAEAGFDIAQVRQFCADWVSNPEA